LWSGASVSAGGNSLGALADTGEALIGGRAAVIEEDGRSAGGLTGAGLGVGEGCASAVRVGARSTGRDGVAGADDAVVDCAASGRGVGAGARAAPRGTATGSAGRVTVPFKVKF
jgi:hypothetical protein